ncbi:MAG TPA: winged helix-turn-helix domain-containing protein, partial [Chthonomonadaceae bacterium]|nr:winged helix-turn-helix domain-containing protein [Chthonomonadaceae bacterium]
MLEEPWRIEMLGRLRVRRGDRDLTRFSTYKTGALLAYLAYNQSRSHARERLMDLLWPDEVPEAARNSLRVALASLRRQLEPPGVAGGSILLADRMQVQLNPASVTTDVAAFEAMVQAAGQAEKPLERERLLEEAVALYGGELLPGYYEDWITAEQQRLADAYIGAVRALTVVYAATGQMERAIEHA